MKVVMTVTMIQTMIELKSVLFFQYHCKLDHKAKHQYTSESKCKNISVGYMQPINAKIKLTLWQSEWSKLVGVLTIPSSEGYQGNSIWIGSFIR